MPALTHGTRLVAALVGAALAVVGTACRTVDTPGFCCTTADDCAAHGATGGLVSCPQPLVCDATRFTCVDPANGGHCDSMTDCMGVTPYCDLATHVCKQCMGTMGCSASAPLCSADEECTACTGEPDCATYAPLGHCATDGPDAGQCVACRDGNDCPAATPVCDGNACRVCRVDADCPSNSCDDGTGACIAATDVIYMAPTGSGTSCTMAQPCGTFASAVALITPTRHTIEMAAGSYVDQLALDAVTVDLHGDGADLTSSAAGPVVDVSGRSVVLIEGLRIHDGHGSTPPIVGVGVQCELASGDTPQLRLARVTVDRNSDVGIKATSCDLTVERSRILTNSGGGMSLNGSSFTVENDFVSGNGLTTGVNGGVVINTISATGAHVFQFNSVTNNVASNALSSGVYCTLINMPLTFGDSIVFGNLGGSGTQVSGGNCAWTYSDLGDTVAGTGNIDMDPQFVNASQNDLHLMPGSPCKNVGDPSSTVKVDIDGDARSDGQPDIGADELTP